MNALVHTLNIGTLATWLSVGGAGSVGILLPAWQDSLMPGYEEQVDEVWSDPEITLGGYDVGESAAQGTGEPDAVASESLPLEASDPLPLPPELPETAEWAPLPELPQLPDPPARKSSPAKPEKSSGAARSQPSRSSSGAAGRGGSPSGSPSGTAAGGGTGGMSNAARLAAGRMPAPVYPAEARRKGQTGTVLVEFTVDGSGRVVSAYAKSPSPWPLLNNEAVRTVRRWKFPPGQVMKLQRPIIFQLR